MDDRMIQTSRLDDQRILDLAQKDADPQIASISAEVHRQSEAIRYLEEVTRDVEAPYIGSYYSV